jgi:hypothetical protein
VAPGFVADKVDEYAFVGCAKARTDGLLQVALQLCEAAAAEVHVCIKSVRIARAGAVK